MNAYDIAENNTEYLFAFFICLLLLLPPNFDCRMIILPKLYFHKISLSQTRHVYIRARNNLPLCRISHIRGGYIVRFQQQYS